MNVLEKLEILADSAKYDASCASSASRRHTGKKIGSSTGCGVCHTWTADGRCVSLLKILLTNICVFDCAYCINRSSNDIRRAIFTPEELAQLTIDFYRRNYIEGLFLSSGVVQSPDHTMELLLRTLRLLRTTYGFGGYIHVKLIPGASEDYIDQAGFLADRVSVNIELPTEASLKKWAPQKSRSAILKPIAHVSALITDNKRERKLRKKIPAYVPAGQSTQLIIGATPETDYQIMRLSEWFYGKEQLKRVYYSAYVPVNEHGTSTKPPLLREHRLYQADWLLRYYGFCVDEILNEDNPMLDEAVDPKICWALRNFDQFPIELTTADYDQLMRIPGVGHRSAQKIIRARRMGRIRVDDLKKLRVVMKRASYFMTVHGIYAGPTISSPEAIRSHLAQICGDQKKKSRQLSFFPLLDQEDRLSVVTGEL